MEWINSKAEIKQNIESAFASWNEKNPGKFIDSLHDLILNRKVRFPLLETAAIELYKLIPPQYHLLVTDKIIERKSVGGNVLAGIVLQLRIPQNFTESIEKGIEYIIQGNEWYVCDIIGERVQGYTLLTLPGEMLPVLKRLSLHENKWIVRCVGVAVHYAVKKGLKKQYAKEAFTLLLSLSITTDFHTKKGIGWAAKTIAKFHPEIIEEYRDEIDKPEVKQWFKTKIKIGLGRTSKYAGRYPG